MNFQLKLGGGAKKKKKKTCATAAAVVASKPNVFDGDSDSAHVDEDEDGKNNNNGSSSHNRELVNRAILKEQEAMRKRAYESMKRAAQDAAVYDYDASYDTFGNSNNNEQTKSNATQESSYGNQKKSRYIGDLLKAAKERNYERDIAYERKMARELEQEEADNIELQNKERFITAGYKRKLEERKLWKETRDQKDTQDEEMRAQDGSGGDGTGLSRFYGNLTKNVAMGGSQVVVAAAANGDGDGNKEHQRQQQSTQLQQQPQVGDFNGGQPSFLAGFARAENDDNNNHVEDAAPLAPTAKQPPTSQSEEAPVVARQERRKQRELKVAAARERYFQRKGMAQSA